ncbi:MAG: hypothetical protein JSW73_02445 [Candidatus Woesearchaeota archaeon]|nr:MAG: hypothetical protein JSW73_02445 [Candidatus Woesearchaeota archaeon]
MYQNIGVMLDGVKRIDDEVIFCLDADELKWDYGLDIFPSTSREFVIGINNNIDLDYFLSIEEGPSAATAKIYGFRGKVSTIILKKSQLEETVKNTGEEGLLECLMSINFTSDLGTRITNKDRNFKNSEVLSNIHDEITNRYKH